MRSNLKIGQAEAAERFNVGISTWQRFEAGAAIKFEVLCALSMIGYNINWLLTGEGEMLRKDAEGLDRDAAEAAMLAIADTVASSAHKMSDNSLKVLFEDFYHGFVEAGREED